MTDLLTAAVTWARSTLVKYRCGWCASGLHSRCPGAFDTPSGHHSCTCAYTWRHADPTKGAA